jgi:predicted HAD superfamily hydrolase
MNLPLTPLPCNIQALSVDVFDTALTRCWARPEHVHLACAHRLRDAGLISLDDTAWLALRRQAEHQATQSRGADLARLDDIYEQLASTLCWTAAQMTAAQNTECAVELAIVWPVAPMQMCWTEAAARGLARRFVSDMYLPTNIVWQMLSRCGFDAASHDVWVSGDKGASKSSGALYGALSQALRAVPASILHIGDNQHSDVDQARRVGLRTKHMTTASLSANEQRVANWQEAPLLLRSLISGAMKIARVNAPPPTHDLPDRGVHDFGRDQAGPLLTLYVWWLLHDAQQRQLQRLYFLARDGQVLLAIAQCLQAQGCAPQVQLHYLHGSRQAWFAASIVHWHEDEVFQILDEPHDRFSEPHKLAKRMGFDNSEQLRTQWPGAIEACAFASNNKEVAQALVRQIPAATALAHTRKLRRLVNQYLAQEGVFGAGMLGIVDLGWRGRLQLSLARILQNNDAATDRTAPALHGYYVALLNDLPGQSTSTLLTSRPGHAVEMPAPAHLFEMLCEADHGTTRGYSMLADGQVAPVFNPYADPAVQAWGLNAYRRGVLEFAAVFAQAATLLPAPMQQHDAVQAMFRALARHWIHTAAPESARAFARMPTTYSSTHEGLRELAPALPSTDAWLRALTLGRLRLSHRQTPWLAGSLAQTGSGRTLRVYVRVWDCVSHLRRRWLVGKTAALAARG